MGVGVRCGGGRQRVNTGRLPRVLLFVIVLAMSLQFYTRDNHFSWLYHNDESSKVSQVMDAKRNFNHPPLMLTVADEVARLSGNHADPQAVVQVGRTLSALYLALANALLVDLAVVWCGTLTGAALGLVLLVQPDLYEIGHYFKEDTLLLLGLSASFWSLAFFGAEPSRRRAVLLGVSLAVLAGSKYVGWFWVVPLGVQAVVWGWRVRRRELGWLVGAFVVVTAWMYWPALRNWSVAREAGLLEITLLLAGDYGTGRAVPHALYWGELAQSIPWVILFLGCLGFVLAGRERRPPGSLWMLISSVAMIIALSWTAKFSDRYELPVNYLMSFVVVTGAVLAWPRSGSRRWLTWLPQAGAVVVAIWIGWRLEPEAARRMWGFRFDSRAQMQQILQTSYRGNLFLVQDEWARVEVAPQTGRSLSSWFVADLGSLDELRRQGVTHVLVSFDVNHRFLDDSVAQFDQQDFTRRREFYRQLFREGRVEHYLPSHAPKALQPGLTLVDIRYQQPKSAKEFRPY